MGGNIKLLQTKAGVGGGIAPVGLKVFDSDFDNLNLGNINGQGAYSYAGTWFNNSGANCTAEIIADPGGGKMLRLADNSMVNRSECWIDLNSGYEVLTAIVEWKVKVNVLAVNSRGNFFFMDGGASKQGGYFRGDAADLYYRASGGTTAKLCNAVIDTWYIIKNYFCRLANYSVWWVDGVFEQSRIAMNSGDKFDRMLFHTRDDFSGMEFDIKYVKIWSLNYSQ